MQPMLAQPLDFADIGRKASDFLMEPKLDGIRCLASWDGRMFSRSAKTDLAPRLPHIAKAVRAINLPQGFWLDGEVGYLQREFATNAGPWPILDFNATVRVTGSQPEEALRKQLDNQSKLGDIGFYVFDMIDTGQGAHRQQAARTLRMLDWLDGLREDGIPYIKPVRGLYSWDEDVYNNYVLAGAEGVILKAPKGMYLPGKRPSNTWYKIKKFDTVDGRIVGFDPGMGKYEGQIGALVVQLEHPDYITLRCSGMDDLTRRRMTDLFAQEYENHWVEVKHYGRVGREGTGSFRHPQFLRMRPDLDGH